MSRFLTSARMRLASVIFAGLPVWLATPAKALHSQEQGTTTSTLNSVSGLDVGLDTVSKEIASWLPESVVLFGKVDPVAQWLDHPLRTRWVASDAFKRLWRTPEALQLRGGITVAEFALGMKLDQLAKDLTERGMYLALDSKSNGFVVVFETASEEWLKDYIDKAIDFMRRDAKSKGNPDPVEIGDYRGTKAYKVQNGIFIATGSRLVLTNSKELGKTMVDRIRDGGKSLVDSEWLRTANARYSESIQSGKATRPAADLWIDLASLRELLRDNDLFKNKAKDFGAELILGGVLSVLANSPQAHMSFGMNESGIAMNLSSPSDPSWFGEARQHYVGPDSKGSAPDPIAMPNRIAAIGTYRNIAELWQRAGDLFDRDVNEQLDQADATLTTIFAGKDFATDILGSIEPEIQIIACEPDFADEKLKPTILLPSFGLVGKLKEPDKLQRELKRTFQSFIGFLNVAGAQQAQPQFELDSLSSDRGAIYSAQYIVENDRKYENGLPIQFNFQPSIAFSKDRVLLCTSLAMAKTWLQTDPNQTTSAAENNADPVPQTWFQADIREVRKILESNTNSIVSQNMLQQGKSRAEAKREFEMLLTALQLFERAKITMGFDHEAFLKMQVDARLSD